MPEIGVIGAFSGKGLDMGSTFRRAGLAAALLMGAAATGGANAAVLYSQGFEINNSGWNVFGGSFDATRVASGTHGVTSQSGSFHAEAAQSDGSAATNWGSYRSVFPVGGYTTSLGIYLDLAATSTNDTRFDWDSAINNSSGAFHRDFVFNGGFYNDSDATGSGARFVFTASNNAGRSGAFPKNPGRDPFAVTTTGWYTFVDKFYDNGGVLADDLSIYNSSNVLLHTWTLSDPTDLMTGIGGNRYGWVVNNEFPFLAIDNAMLRTNLSAPEPASMALFGPALAGFLLMRRRRKASADLV